LPERWLTLPRALPFARASRDIIRGRTGALIVLADEEDVAEVCSGGVRIDAPFNPKLVYELAKMDGAIIVDRDCAMIRQATRASRA